MDMSLRASPVGLELIKERKQQTQLTDEQWCREASKIQGPKLDWDSQELKEEGSGAPIFAVGCTTGTLKNFLAGRPFRDSSFKIFCQVIGLEWQEVVDPNSNSQIQQAVEKASFYEWFWVGRQNLIDSLSVKLSGDCRVLILTGITGIGKTALAYQLAALKKKDWQRVKPLNFEDFEDNTVVSFASVAAELLIRLGETVTAEERKEPEHLLERLLLKLNGGRFIVQMDSIERLLAGDEETGWNNFQDSWWKELFQRLLSIPDLQSRIILTSQDLPTEFQEMGHPEHWRVQPLTGLEPLERLMLFQRTGLKIDATSPYRPYLERIGAAYEGHPLALLIIAGEIICEPYSGDVIQYWSQEREKIEEIEKVYRKAEIEGDNDRLRLERLTPIIKTKIEASLARLQDYQDAYQLLCVGAAYRRSVPKGAWFLGFKKRLGYENLRLQIALETLCDRYLVEVEGSLKEEEWYWLHNLIRSVALTHLKNVRVRLKSA